MAIESQGVQVRRASTTAGTIAHADATVLSISSGATSKILSSDTGAVDFATSSFSTGMRLESNSSLTTSIMTIKTVAASVMEVYETATAHASTALSFTGRTMETIGEVVSFSGPSGSLSVIDITNLRNTAKQKLVGIKDEGQVTLEMNYSASSTDLHGTLRDDMTARANQTFDVVLTDSTLSPTSYYFEAYVTNWGITGSVDNALKGSVTLDISSAVHKITAA